MQLYSWFITWIAADTVDEGTSTDPANGRLQLGPCSHHRQPAADAAVHSTWSYALRTRRRLELPRKLLFLFHHAQHSSRVKRSEVKVIAISVNSRRNGRLRSKGHRSRSYIITLSTIGFGDLVPGTSLHADSQGKMVLCALYLLIGLALLAMCFDLMQEEVRRKFRALGAKLGLFDHQ